MHLRELLYEREDGRALTEMLGLSGVSGPGREPMFMLKGAFRRKLGWVDPTEHEAEVGELRRCWAVHAAREDVDRLWESIDNDALPLEFNRQFREWEVACERAALEAVREWAGDEIAAEVEHFIVDSETLARRRAQHSSGAVDLSDLRS
jgi:hypothetical protein